MYHPCVLQGPQIVTVPTVSPSNRYWIVPFLDAYLNYYGAIGSDFNSSAGQYLVVGRSENDMMSCIAVCLQLVSYCDDDLPQACFSWPKVHPQVECSIGFDCMLF